METMNAGTANTQELKDSPSGAGVTLSFAVLNVGHMTTSIDRVNTQQSTGTFCVLNSGSYLDVNE